MRREQYRHWREPDLSAVSGFPSAERAESADSEAAAAVPTVSASPQVISEIPKDARD